MKKSFISKFSAFLLLILLASSFLFSPNNVFAVWTLNNFTHTPVSYEAGATTTYNYSFTNDTPLDAENFDLVVLTYPAGYSVDSVDVSQITGTINGNPATTVLPESSVNTGSRNINIVFNIDMPANSDVTISIPGVTNPSTPGEYVFTPWTHFYTQFGGNGTVDAPDSMSSITITEGAPTPGSYTAEFWNFGEGESPEVDFDALGEPDYTENNFDISNANWGEGSPDGSIGANNFVGRFTATSTFIGGPVRFSVSADDGVRIYVDDEMIIERWSDAFADIGSVVVNLEEGEHSIVVEYYENGGFAYLQLAVEDLGLTGAGTEEDPWQVTECYEIFNPGYYELQNDIEDVEGDCIVISADDVFFNGGGFTISSDGEQENQAIYSQGHDRLSIENITIDAFYDGIMLRNSEGESFIDNVTISNSGDDAIDLEGVTILTITDVAINDSGDDGIQVRAYEDTELEEYVQSTGITITDSSIELIDDNGIEAEGVFYLIVENTTFDNIGEDEEGGDGVYVESYYDSYEEEDVHSGSVTISGSTFTNVEDDAIYLSYVSQGFVLENNISDIDSDAIYIENGTNITVSENIIDTVSADGIDFSYDNDEDFNVDIFILDNVLTNIGDNGIELDQVNGATITGNSLQVSDTGIYVEDSEDVVSSDNTITPTTETYLVIPENEYSFLELDIEETEGSVSETDDDSFTHTLPFTFNFMGRDILAIEISTNGAIELLEVEENCQICSGYGLPSAYFDNDVIFSSFDDLVVYNDDYVAVFDIDDEGGERVVVEFRGRTINDQESESPLLYIQTILYPNGTIEWNFNEMNFENYGNQMFTGVYDFEEGTLYQAGKLIDESGVGYAGDFSGNGTFEEVEGFNANIGINLDNVANSNFIGNSIRADKWVYAEGLEEVVFNDSDSGNDYYLLAGAGAWTAYDITDSTGNGYADGGADRPFSQETLGADLWEGEGEDYFPKTENEPTVVTPRRSGGMASSSFLAKLGLNVNKIDNDKKDDDKKTEDKAEEKIPEDICPADQILTQNLRSGSRNGRFNAYTGAVVTQANILQAHLNRLGFNSGPVDGILGRLSDGAIRRMQTFLGTRADGFVGPVTRGLINKSCGSKGLQN